MDQFDWRIDFKFFHNFGPMGFDRTDADKQHISDLSGGMSFGNQLENLSTTLEIEGLKKVSLFMAA